MIQLEEKSIVEESVGHLEACGISRIIIVTGFKAQLYDELAERYPGQMRTVHNPHYEHSGNLYSLVRATPLVDEDFLLLDSDLVYEPRALLALLQYDQPNAVLVTTPDDAGDEEYVQAKQLKLVAMSKNKRNFDVGVVGEWVGILRISTPDS